MFEKPTPGHHQGGIEIRGWSLGSGQGIEESCVGRCVQGQHSTLTADKKLGSEEGSYSRLIDFVTLNIVMSEVPLYCRCTDRYSAQFKIDECKADPRRARI